MPRVSKKSKPETTIIDFRPKSELEQLLEADENLTPLAEDARVDVPMPKVEVKEEPKGAPTVVAELPTLPPIDETKPVVVMRPCALETAPVGSKLVMLDNPDTGKVPVLQTPMGESMLALNDIAFTLPIGAKVRKVVEGRFEAKQLGDTTGKASLLTLTAREAIEGFVRHFHG